MTRAPSEGSRTGNRGGPATPGALAKLEQISPQSMGATLGALEDRGLVERRADPDDGRRVVMSLTDAAGVIADRHGVLAVTVGYGWCFGIDAASYLVVLAALWMMRPAELHRSAAPPRAKGQIREGVRHVAQLPNLWISFVMLAAIGLFSYNFNVTLPLFATRTLHGGDRTFTLLYCTFSAGAVAGGLTITSRNLVQIRHINIGAAALGVTMLGLAVTPGTGIALPAVFLVGLASILYMTATTAIIQLRVTLRRTPLA